MRTQIQAKRDALAQMRAAALQEQAELDRQLCALTGALQVLDELLALPDDEAQETRTQQSPDYAGSADARAHDDMLEYLTEQEVSCDSPASSS